MEAAETGSIAKALRLLDEGISAFSVDQTGYTALTTHVDAGREHDQLLEVVHGLLPVSLQMPYSPAGVRWPATYAQHVRKLAACSSCLLQVLGFSSSSASAAHHVRAKSNRIGSSCFV